jgi:hypothetical protein
MPTDSEKVVVGFDLTIAEGPETPRQFVIEFLKGWAKKWVFQLEEGAENGYRHWQIRLHLFTKKRLQSLILQTKHLRPPGYQWTWSVTSAPTHEGSNFSYVMKEDTRVDGPWTDKDFEDPPLLTRQLREFNGYELYPWQADLKKMTQSKEDLLINVVIDTSGNTGKSIFAEHLEYEGLAFEIPPMRSMEDIMQCVMSVRPKKAYLIDLPRGMKKDNIADFYSGIEALKNGMAYDKRNQFKMKMFDRPQIFVFTSTPPDLGLLSIDRWKVWVINDQLRLVDMTHEYISQWRAAVKKRKEM